VSSTARAGRRGGQRPSSARGGGRSNAQTGPEPPGRPPGVPGKKWSPRAVLNFLEVLRALVIGEERGNVQQAAKLKSIIAVVPLNAPGGSAPKTHPLLRNAHDLPVLLEALKTAFDELAGLGVATEHQMHRVQKAG
jgi:hypothetical protein